MSGVFSCDSIFESFSCFLVEASSPYFKVLMVYGDSASPNTRTYWGGFIDEPILSISIYFLNSSYTES